MMQNYQQAFVLQVSSWPVLVSWNFLIVIIIIFWIFFDDMYVSFY